VPDAAAPSLCHQAVALPYIAGGLGANPVAAVGGLDLPYKLSSEGGGLRSARCGSSDAIDFQVTRTEVNKLNAFGTSDFVVLQGSPLAVGHFGCPILPILK
jgi:hypothetical protein